MEFFTAHRWGMENNKGYTKEFLQCRSRFTTCYKTRIGCSVCAAAGTSCLSAAQSLTPVSAVVHMSELNNREDLPLGSIDRGGTAMTSTQAISCP